MKDRMIAAKLGQSKVEPLGLVEVVLTVVSRVFLKVIYKVVC